MYRELNDNEIIYMINDNNDYYEIMFDKYKPLISKLCHKYMSLASSFGYEYNDLMQISSIALLNAINNYKEEKNILFYTYVMNCIENALKTEIKNQLTNRKKVLNSAISYDEIYLESNQPLMDFIKDEKSIDPMDFLIIREREEEYIKFINLLPIEVAVSFEMKNFGFNVHEIAKYLNIDEKFVLKNIYYAKNRLSTNC